ncbi:MAG: metal ABC transporter permease [Barnesiella sp.]|nr:metal ABC transporter permease [Barnesiella sp.]MBD5258701.1 metal ABC transporter permease [Barnesiella sp.]
MDLLDYEFFRNALIGISLIAVASSVIGTYIFARRLVAIAGGITHACFGGLGLGYFTGINPILMAGVFAVGSSVGVEWVSSRHNVREDSAIAVVWSLGMAVGVLFVFLTPGYVPELNSFLFGNILTISQGDIVTFAIFTLLLIAFVAAFYHKIVVCAFDRDFARVSGMPTAFITTVMTVFTAVAIVLTIKLVGVMLLMSMLSLPQMIAETRYHRLNRLMVASGAVSLVCCIGGLLAACYIEVPCSALIVIIMALVYAVARTAAWIARRRSAASVEEYNREATR